MCVRASVLLNLSTSGLFPNCQKFGKCDSCTVGGALYRSSRTGRHVLPHMSRWSIYLGLRMKRRKNTWHMKGDLWVIIPSVSQSVYQWAVTEPAEYVMLFNFCSTLYGTLSLWFRGTVSVCVYERELSHSHFNHFMPGVSFTLGWCHHYFCLFTSFSFNNLIWYKTSGQLILTNCNGWREGEGEGGGERKMPSASQISFNYSR